MAQKSSEADKKRVTGKPHELGKEKKSATTSNKKKSECSNDCSNFHRYKQFSERHRKDKGSKLSRRFFPVLAKEERV